MWKCGDVEMWRCGDVEMWECEDGEILSFSVVPDFVAKQEIWSPERSKKLITNC